MSHSNASRTRPNNDRTKFVRPRGRAVCGLAREANFLTAFASMDRCFRSAAFSGRLPEMENKLIYMPSNGSLFGSAR